MSCVIKVDNIAKNYLLHHQGGQAPYLALREVLTEGVKSLGRRLLDGRAGQPDRARREEFWALQDISFEVSQGERVGIIGRNGAGKSTLLKILSRITEPTRGCVRLRGRVASLLEVGTGFHPELTGRENIFLNGAILGMRREEIKKKFDAIVDFAEVERFLDTPVKRYSSGMYVRLAFAVAAHLEPEILIVDEVLAVGDAQFQKKCLGKMEDVSTREGRTLLFVSHNMAAVQSLCSRCVVLGGGKVLADGPTEAGIAAYLGQLQSTARIRLAQRPDRTGEGRVRFVALDLLDERSQPTECGVSGQQLTVRLYYRVDSPKPLRRCRVSVSVHRLGQAYFLASTELTSGEELVLEGEGHLDCVIEALPLSKSEYTLNCFAEANGAIQDYVESAGTLSVVDGDFYGTGRNYPAGWEGKGVLIRYHWRW